MRPPLGAAEKSRPICSSAPMTSSMLVSWSASFISNAAPAPLNGRGTSRSMAVPTLGSSPLRTLLARKGQCESTAAAKTCPSRSCSKLVSRSGCAGSPRRQCSSSQRSTSASDGV
eukprot:scaffold26390_cov39-Phaeocystis_antarctica.AAC.2